jgi:hypothetical protein
MPITIVQNPKYKQVPVGSDIIFTVSHNTIVATEKKVKFIAEVHVSPYLAPNLSSAADVIGRFKTTPNNAGVGIFDLSSVLENYVKADHLAMYTQGGSGGSQYKEAQTTFITPHPIHLVDKYSGNRNSVKYLAIQFKIEYLGADSNFPDAVNIAAGESQNSDYWRIFNGYLKQTDILRYTTSNSSSSAENFGYFFGDFNMDDDEDKFLTNAPTTQYANIDDYGTFPFFNQSNEVRRIELIYYNAAGGVLSFEYVYKTVANGGDEFPTSDNAKWQIMFFGCFPANLRNWPSLFHDMVEIGGIIPAYYTVQAQDSSHDYISEKYTIHINCPDLKGYESIRLTWLNQWGVWDYYTFTKKSTRSISTSGSTYTQQRGTWNETTFRLDGYKGGKKAFRVNATEKITMNTDFVSEADGAWFEELINSPEVYMLEGFQDDLTNSYLNNYVTPVRLTTSSYTKKTVANDKLMQYTFEVEKAKTLRTQSI